MPSALVTNTISNALHALFLFIYFLFALTHYLKKDRRFTLLIVLSFLSIFIIKIMGAYVHYFGPQPNLTPGWIAISLMIIMLNYLVLHALEIPDGVRASFVFFSIACSFLYLTHREFIYLASSEMVVYLIVAYYAKSLTRIAFLMIVFSNIIWIAVRTLENWIIGQEINPAYRYDNDFYHLLLIISSFLLLHSITKGDWSYPKNTPL